MEGLESSDHHPGSLVIDHDRGLHQDAGTIVIFIERTKSHFVGTVGSPSDERRKGVIRSTRSSLGEQSDGWRSFGKKPRSTRDCGPIVADRRIRGTIRGSPTIDGRSPCNLSPIAKRSWPNRSAIVPTISAIPLLNQGEIKATTHGIKATFNPPPRRH